MSELKNCPFCGGKAKINEYPSSGTVYEAGCVSCMATSGLHYAGGRKSAITAWNTRAQTEREKKLVGVLEYNVYFIQRWIKRVHDKETSLEEFFDVVSHCPSFKIERALKDIGEDQ